MTYERLPIEAFGRQLIESGDLDPVYIALAGVEWPETQKRQWLLAYWLFYHPGAACYLSQQSGAVYWASLRMAAKNETAPPVGDRWPRASERRHFRGDKCVVAVDQLNLQFSGSITRLFDALEGSAKSYNQLYSFVCSLPQFGPWIAWKVADMMERCMGVHVDFDLKSMTMFDDPKKAALMVWKEKMGYDPKSEAIRPKDPDGSVRSVVEHLINEFRDLSAPPSHDRAIGYQEVETVLCKYKSHLNGHYSVGKDIKDINEGLSEWSKVSEAARELLHTMPKSQVSIRSVA